MTQPQTPNIWAEPEDFKPAGYPLIRFKATVKQIQFIVNEPDPERGRTRQTQSIKLGFIDLTPIETHEPYPFPTMEFSIPYSSRSETRWAAFSASFRKLVPADIWKGAADPLKLLEGKVVEMQMKPGKLRAPLKDDNGEDVMDASGKQKWGVTDADCWQIIDIEGFTAQGGPSLMDTIVEACEGKTDQEILEYIFTEQKLKGMSGYTDVVEAATDRKLIPQLKELGKISQDTDGKWHKVA